MVLERHSIADVDVVDVWTALQQDRGAQLVDVRTKAEWAYVGLPDITSTGKKPILVEWHSFQDSKPDPAFVSRLEQELAGLGADKAASLYFICRSGGRSLMAAKLMAAAGWAQCHNVADGFEGPLDGERHRGRVAGWKARGLPWLQG
jgi:rhodanese-related sulfurtransferase